MKNSPVLFDTSVLIDHFRTDCHAARIDSLLGNVCHSSVVLAELWRGVKSTQEATFLDIFQRQHPILTPTEENWLESGQLLMEMKKVRGLEAIKLRDLHFDVLIALTARTYDARLITSNRSDFEMIHQFREFWLELW